MGAAKLASGLNIGAYCIEASELMLGLERLASIGRVGTGSPDISGGATGILDHVCGSGMSIAQAIFADISGTVAMADGCIESVSIELNTSMWSVIPAGGATADSGGGFEGICDEGGLWLLDAIVRCAPLEALADASPSASMTGNF